MKKIWNWVEQMMNFLFGDGVLLGNIALLVWFLG